MFTMKDIGQVAWEFYVSKANSNCTLMYFIKAGPPSRSLMKNTRSEIMQVRRLVEVSL